MTPPMLPRVEAVDKRDRGLGPYNHEVVENPEHMGLRAARLPRVRMQSRSTVNERMPHVIPCLRSQRWYRIKRTKKEPSRPRSGLI
ncbi:hypothetical protein R1flu_010323 [Riccia fluitans]|uniref:Uncharacterized protein n=1 Tax=Riccia fluitans TaxID=41844 RepID=A0ABD1Z4Z7_9MARC